MSKFKRIDEPTVVIALHSKHITLRAVNLVTNTDLKDTLVEETVRECYLGGTESASGQIFIITDRVQGRSTVLIIPAPDFAVPSVRIQDSSVIVDSCGYPVFVGECEPSGAERLVRDWYREQYTPAMLHAMSNTWGDRNGRTRVCDEFIRREIDSGADLGLDVVQIDDGWQLGIPDVYDEEKNRLFEGDFWELNRDIFPEGMNPLAEYARTSGIELGLWFAPHSRGVFEHFERDLDVLRSAYRRWGIRYFKLDMINLPTREHCERMTELLDRVTGFGNGTSVELDVTADKRLGYLAAAPYGTIFVENRYTAWANYYPYRTLRNAWMLSRFVPLSKLQFELVNPELYTDRYDLSDPFRHGVCDADYLFASVMLSNPLFWMETQFLSDKARADLKSIIPAWKNYRAELTHADVHPVGEQPSGASLTGFVAEGADFAHIILLREATDRDTVTVDVGFDLSDHEIIKEKSPTQVTLSGSRLTATLTAQHSYLWLRATKKQ